MTSRYRVKQGDCMSSIAGRFGHFWATLWNEPGNAELKALRADPNVLLADDLVIIPDLRPKQETGATAQRHRFRRLGEPARLRLQILLEDPFAEPDATSQEAGAPQPRANQDYVLEVEHAVYRGVTDAEGMLEVGIPTGASRGQLTIGPDNTVIKLALGHLDPIDEISGVQGRLNNLGFHCGDATGALNDETRAALRRFQEVEGLEVTGQADQPSRNKLKEVHGS